ncbi:MAG: transcription elongation factor GreB [Gammaproteobacteria bacterium]
MSRYRPPAPQSSPYITAAGFRALSAERDELWARRREVVTHLAAAAAEGDRSENAEYIYRKKQLREIDRRIRYLQKRLPGLTVVEQVPPDRRKVYFSASVTVGNEAGDEACYRIVGADEIDPARNWISIDAPMSRALLGRAVDDEVTVTTPSGAASWFIISVSYEDD